MRDPLMIVYWRSEGRGSYLLTTTYERGRTGSGWRSDRTVVVFFVLLRQNDDQGGAAGQLLTSFAFCRRPPALPGHGKGWSTSAAAHGCPAAYCIGRVTRRSPDPGPSCRPTVMARAAGVLPVLGVLDAPRPLL